MIKNNHIFSINCCSKQFYTSLFLSEEELNNEEASVKYNLPVSVTLRQQLNVGMPGYQSPNIINGVKIGNELVCIDSNSKNLIGCNALSTDIRHICLPYKPYYITDVDRYTVAVSCTYDKTILLVDISTGRVTSTFKTMDFCYGISYNDEKVYVIIDLRTIHVMNMKGKKIGTIHLPSQGIVNITVDKCRDLLVCINCTSIYCCLIDGTLIWEFENEKYKDFSGVTTDDEGNVYVSNEKTNTVVVISNDGQHYKDVLTGSDGLHQPSAIYVDKQKPILFV